MGEEDLLGMGDNFDILEFADALDDLDDLPQTEAAADAKKAMPPTTTEAVSTASTTSAPVTQPPPYTQAPSAPSTVNTGQQAQIRAPPPPYPVHKGTPTMTPTTSKVLIKKKRFNKSFVCIIITPHDYRRLLKRT